MTRGKVKRGATRRNKSKARGRKPEGLADAHAAAAKDRQSVADREDSGRQGYSFETKEKFSMPPTSSTLHMLSRFWEPSSFVTIVLLLGLIWGGLPMHLLELIVSTRMFSWLQQRHAGCLSDTHLLLNAIFWRFAYNVILGFILRLQSESKFLTKFVRSVRLHGSSVSRWMLIKLISGSAVSQHPPSNLHHEVA